MQVELSPLQLAREQPLRRDPPRPPHLREPGYDDRFDDVTVFFDCFRCPDGVHIHLAGPPLRNLADPVVAAVADAAFAGGWPRPAFMRRWEARAWEMDRVSRIVLRSAQERLSFPAWLFAQSEIAVQPNHCDLFAGRKALLTMNKDSDLVWIKDWVRFFVRGHGCDAVLLYDNRSTLYAREDVHDAIMSVNGVRQAVVVDWPYAFGPSWDSASFDSEYSQLGMFENARFRFLAAAAGVVQLDVDEIVLTQDGASIFDLLDRSTSGYLNIPGTWIENTSASERAAEPRRHRDYQYRAVPPQLCPAKWAAVPARCGTAGQWMHHHWTGPGADPLSRQTGMRHFKAITRRIHRAPFEPLDPARHALDADLQRWRWAFDEA